jgi:hypothetical protein
MKLPTTWTLWYTEQDLDKYSWKLTNYRKIRDVSTVQDFWDMIQSIPENRWVNGMYFLMREGVYPMWEDKANVNGGSYSFRIPKIYAYMSWIELAIQLLGDTLMPSHRGVLNGISISPKNNTVTVKIWNNDKRYNETDEIPEIYNFIGKEVVLYKPHS